MFVLKKECFFGSGCMYRVYVVVSVSVLVFPWVRWHFVSWVSLSGFLCTQWCVCVALSVCCVLRLFGTQLGSGLLQSHIPPAPLCSVLQKIFAFSTTHNFSSSIATRCGSCGPRPHSNEGSSSCGSLLWRLPWELALLQARGGGEGVCMYQAGRLLGAPVAPSLGRHPDHPGGCFSAWVLPGIWPKGGKQ